MELVLAADAADLDSFCCAELLRASWAATGRRACALLPIPSKELTWRPDIAAVMAYLQPLGWRCQLDFSDTFDFSLLDQADLRLHLVDRHTLPPSWLAARPWLEQLVQSVSDHRPDTGACASAPRREVQPVASCATLLFEQWGCPQSSWQRLLYAAAILQDSELLCSPRTSARDRAAVLQLKGKVLPEHWRWLQHLPQLRAQSALLPAWQQLRQDLKWTREPAIPLAVVQGNAEDFWRLPQAEEAVAGMAAAAGVALILHKPPRPARRQLSVWRADGPWPSWLDHLLRWPDAAWQEQPAPTAQRRVFALGNSNLTRKELLYTMERVLEPRQRR